MPSHRRIWRRLALALCAALLLSAPARSSTTQQHSLVFPPESILLPWRTVQDIAAPAIDNGRLVWLDYSDQLWMIDIQTRQRRPLGQAGAHAHSPHIRDDMVVWSEIEQEGSIAQPQTDRLRGVSLRDGTSFAISPAAEQITGWTMDAERVFWARQVGPHSQIMASSLPPQGQPTLLAEVSNARVTQLALNGSELSWLEQRETAPHSGVDTSRIQALDSAAGGTPVTLVTVSGRVQRYVRVQDGLAWSIAAGTPGRKQLFVLDRNGAQILVDQDVIAFEPFGYEVTVLNGQGVVAYDLRDGGRRGITGLRARSQVTRDESAVCWDGLNEPSFVQCYSRADNGVFETLPPGKIIFMHISAGVLLLGTRSADPQDPITVYAQTLERLFRRAKPMSPQPNPETGDFDRLWQRLDLLVQQGRANRSWTWGPEPISQDIRELYAEGASGVRTVRYYDKSRMEVNDPSADPNSAWYITNGLLPIELITGRVQTGNQSFEQLAPAAVTAVGDPGQFPTYADLAVLYQSPGAADPAAQGRPVTRLLSREGTSGTLADYTRDPATLAATLSNGHPVPRAFADFMNQRGQTWQDGRAVSGPLYDPLFVFGLPVTPPAWVRVRVGGQPRPILFQVFERRVLTYNPANPPGFRVEMGNVGQHYFLWRYP